MGCGVVKGQSAFSTTPKALYLGSGFFVSENPGVFRKCYQVLGELGNGAYATVLLASNLESGAKRAVKIIPKKRIISHEVVQRYLSEVDILRQMDHPNIVRVYEYFQDETYLYIVTELCEGGELLDKIVSKTVLPEAVVAQYMRQLLSAVLYCHTKHIVHRDLKLENLLLLSKADDSLLKVIDFGTSVLFDPRKKLKRRLGTVCYIAPEVLGSGYDEKCDMWSCGVLLYVLLSGRMPFAGEDDHQILANAARGNYSMTTVEWLEVSDAAKSLVRGLLQTDPKKRLSASQAFNDPWVQQTNRETPAGPAFSEAIRNLSSFRARNMLQKAVLCFMSSRLISTEEVQELAQVFRALDQSGSGRLSKRELHEGVQRVMGLDLTPKSTSQILGEVDADNSGFIDYSEFLVAAMDKQKLLSTERLKAAFAAFDADHNGKITTTELRMMLDQKGAMDAQVWESIISGVDKNGDGEVDWKEFKQMMLNLE